LLEFPKIAPAPCILGVYASCDVGSEAVINRYKKKA
jgi:hypothetical protein